MKTKKLNIEYSLNSLAFYINISGLTLLLCCTFSGCAPPLENNKNPDSTKNKATVNKRNIEESLKQFNTTLNGKNASVFPIYPSQQYTSDLEELFDRKGLVQASALGNNRFKQFKELKYAQMDLFFLKYQNSLLANEAFERLISKAPFLIHKSAAEPETNSKFILKRCDIQKSGSYVLSLGKYIIFLVKRCNGNALENVSWQEYENIFLEHLETTTNTTKILFSNCGDHKFEVRKLKQQILVPL